LRRGQWAADPGNSKTEQGSAFTRIDSVPVGAGRPEKTACAAIVQARKKGVECEWKLSERLR
jgi:hypothetical protein